MTDTLYFASDHAGVTLKAHLLAFAKDQGQAVHDLGPADGERVDYPDYAAKLAHSMAADPQARGVLICGSGIGISMAANRYPHIRAALCQEPLSAALCREHNNANVLVLGERLIGPAMAEACLTAFLTTPFAGGRHEGRVAKLGKPQQIK